MATKASAAKASRRSAKHSAKQKQKKPKVPTGSNQDERSHRFGLQTSALDSVPSLAERLQAQREQLFKAMSIVECCKYATGTLYEVGDFEYMGPVFDTICDLLDTAAGELEQIASECGDLA